MTNQYKRRILLMTSVATLSLSFSGTLHAQSPAPSPMSQPTSGDGEVGSISSIPEILVTAQRRSEGIQSVPIAIQAIGRDALQDKGIRNVQDLAQFMPNVTITSPTGPGSQPNITIRGIGLNDFNTNNAGPNGVYIDEFYLSAPNSQGTSLFDLERVEVLKGPQGTLYGRNTSGGAINFITVKPSETFDYRAHAEYSSYDTVNLEGAVGGRVAENLSARIAAVYNYSEGFVRNTYKNRWEHGSNNYGLRGQLLWNDANAFKALLRLQYVHQLNRPLQYKFYGTLNPASYDPLSTLLGSFVKCSPADTYAGLCIDLFGQQASSKFYSGTYNRDEKLRLTDFQAQLRMDYDAGGIDLTSITGYDVNKRIFPENVDSTYVRSVELDQASQSWSFTQELRASHTGTKYNWVLGAYYLHELLKQQQPLRLLLDLDTLFGPGGGDGVATINQTDNRQKTVSHALFGQIEYELLPQFRVITGARYTWDKKNFQSDYSERFQDGGMDNFGPSTNQFSFENSLNQKKFNWRLAANYKIDNDVMIFGNITTGFKGGGFNGGFLSADPAMRVLQLRPVEPEKVTSYEIGLKSAFLNHKVVFNISSFYNDYRNQQLLVLVPNPTPTQPAFFALDNAKKARTYGIDADLTFRVTRELSLTGQLGLLHSELVSFTPSRDINQPDYSGNRLTYAPKVTATFGADYRYPVGSDGELKAHYDVNYRSSQYFDPSNSAYLKQDGYVLHNARLSYAFANNAVELGAFARNIFAKHYFIHGSDLSEPFGFVQKLFGSPRSLGVDLTVRY